MELLPEEVVVEQSPEKAELLPEEVVMESPE